MLLRTVLGLTLSVALAALLVVCSDNPVKPGDSTAPGSVDNLTIYRIDRHSVVLSFTAPGDDGEEGQATRYDIRHHSDSSSLVNWNDAQSVEVSAEPNPVGTVERIVVAGSPPVAPVYWGVRVADERLNWSDVSNLVSEDLTDTIPPAQITHLQPRAMDSVRISLYWQSPGDDSLDGIAAAFDLRYSTAEITEMNWDSAIRIPNPPLPGPRWSRHRDTLSGLEPITTYYFGIKTYDDGGNGSALSNIGSATTSPKSVPIVWEKVVGGAGFDEGTVIIEAHDGGVIVAGRTGSYGEGGTDTYIVKLSVDGELEWEKVYGGTGHDYATDIIATSDGGYAVCGVTHSSGGNEGDGFILKLTSGGDKVWEYPVGTTENDSLTSLAETSDGGFILAGRTGNSGSLRKAYWIKTDNAGVVEWTKEAYHNNWICDEEYPPMSIATVVVGTPDGHIISGWMAHWQDGSPLTDLCGYTMGQLHFIKLDLNGNQVFSRPVGWEEPWADWYISEIKLEADQGFTVMRHTHDGHAILMRFGPNGGLGEEVKLAGSFCNFHSRYSFEESGLVMMVTSRWWGGTPPIFYVLDPSQGLVVNRRIFDEPEVDLLDVVANVSDGRVYSSGVKDGDVHVIKFGIVE